MSGSPEIRFVPVLVSMLFILISGVYDDFKPLPPRNKLLIQILAALCVIIPGYTFYRLFLFNAGPFSSPWFLYPLSFIWIVGITNAMNFIDGVDGLAGGVSAIAALTYGAIFIYFSHSSLAILLCISLAAVTGGFLVFNLPLPKAKIFMGDGGSQFLGFLLAILPLIETRGGANFRLPLIYAAALLLIPIFDTIAAIWRRLREGRRIDSPDKLHIHHKLMNLGLQARGVDAILYGLQILIGVLVFISLNFEGVLSLIILGIAYCVGLTFFSVIHFMNRRVVQRIAGTAI
jgi:UDP-GlcNAc:undecaprenyl-phosphate GlcNAc-1-phosphate transferase